MFSEICKIYYCLTLLTFNFVVIKQAKDELVDGAEFFFFFKVLHPFYQSVILSSLSKLNIQHSLCFDIVNLAQLYNSMHSFLNYVLLQWDI